LLLIGEIARSRDVLMHEKARSLPKAPKEALYPNFLSSIFAFFRLPDKYPKN
jgi:hypothetical protein|tara:strand:+ start:176 stop:331 length:156 start_codon:yes stop_codon:yes gene_type:complete